jgi:hypothetical protein
LQRRDVETAFDRKSLRKKVRAMAGVFRDRLWGVEEFALWETNDQRRGNAA